MKQGGGGKEYSFLDDAKVGGDVGSRSTSANEIRALLDSVQPGLSMQRKYGGEKRNRELLLKVGSCIAYGSVSVSITLFNKAIFSVYKFEFPAFLTLLQVSMTAVFMLSLGRARVFRYCDEGKLAIQWSTAKQVFPLAFFWMLYVQSGVIALRYLTVPMFGVLRRATTLLTAAGEYLAFGTVTPASSMLSVVVMVSGAAMAGATDLSFSAKGYAWVSVCIASTAAYLILIRKIGKNTGLNQHALLLYNNLLSLPMILAWFMLATDEPSRVLSAPQLLDPRFLVFLLVSVSQAFLLNLCIFWCTTANSPLATTIVGAYGMKNQGSRGEAPSLQDYRRRAELFARVSPALDEIPLDRKPRPFRKDNVALIYPRTVSVSKHDPARQLCVFKPLLL